MICSSDPFGMMRGSTASASSSARLSADSVPSAGPPRRATSASYGSTLPPWPRASSARHNSSVCQPPRALRIATSITLPLVQRRAQHVGAHLPAVKRAAGRGAGEPYLRRAEEERLDLIEVVLVPREDVVERR